MAEKSEKKKDPRGVFVLVTTDKDRRGVFAGWLPEFPGSIPDELELADARNAVYWSSQTHGVFGLAATGPGKGSRIGPKVPRLRVNGVTAIAECSPEAAERWEVGTWD